MNDIETLRLPCTLRIGEEELHAHTLLRHLAGKRMVLAGQWRGREIVAKIYLDRRRRNVHARREMEGAHALQARGIDAPELLHEARNEAMVALIFARISPAETALERWQAAQSLQQQLEILRALIAVTARLHSSGLLQKDLHLKNFLFSGEKLYALDAGDIAIRGKALTTEQALDNLGLLFAQLYPVYDRLAHELYIDYARIRQWSVNQKELQNLQTHIDRRRTRRKREYLDKTMRSCSAFETASDMRRFSVWNRKYDSPAFRAALENLDTAMDAGRMLKDGGSSTVATILIDGRELLVKRYNLKSFWHACRRFLRRTRAFVSWRNAHRLVFYGIATPIPVALVEKRWGPLRRSAYFICEYLEAQNCKTFFRRTDLPAAQKQTVIDKICALFSELERLGISHGDTKATNFLVTGQGIALIDLDAMQEFDDRLRAAGAHAKDIERFLRNWDNFPELRTVFEHQLKTGRAEKAR